MHPAGPDQPLAGLSREELEAEHRRLAGALGEARARIDALLTSPHIGLAFLDAELRYVGINEVLARLNGPSAADHIGRSIAEVLPAHWPMLEPIFRQVLAGVPFHGDLTASTATEPYERRWWRISYLPVRTSEAIIGVACAIEDVTATKVAERWLRVLGETSRVMAQSELDVRVLLPAVVGIVSRELDAACGILLCSPEGTAVPAALCHPDQAQQAALERHLATFRVRVGEGVLGRVLSTGEPALIPVLDAGLHQAVGRPEDRALCERFPIRSLAVVPLRVGGAVAGALAVARFSDDPLTGDDQRLVAAIADRAGLALDNARQHEAGALARAEAESASRAKDDFLAMLGHELRNPLAPILTALRLLEMRGGGGQRERAIIERQAQHLVRLVDDLLDVSRITRGAVALERERIEVATVIARALEQVEPLLAARAHHLEVAVPPAGLVVDADATRLAQVVSNLLTNAAKYTEPGGRIAVSARRDGDEVVISVRDSGIGIGTEMLPHIFDAFVQERQALDRARGGLGLGLAIVRSLVLLHGGSVSVRSEGRGRGSEFLVRLAAATGDGRATAARPAPAAPRGAALRILVVDDNEDAADLLAEGLAMVGHEVRVAYDGPRALAAVEGFAPDVALLDIGLPVMDGYELGRRLRAHPALQHTRLVAVSGYGQDADRQRSADAGFLAHLVKPVEMESLLAAIERVTRTGG